MDIRKYIYSHCVSPVTIPIWDSYSQSWQNRQVPCGKCLHCQNTHVNEWCTRLFAQRKYSKYCYYVSLDYAPFDLTSSVAHQLAIETAACYHNINKNNHYAMHPLVLCKNHLQDFYKRLRKNTGLNIQYFACGEYGTHANGSGYGRPHFHNIIFCDSPISNEHFIKAWSIYGYSIGRVDIVDMNGIALDAKENLKIFRYVCKYLQKSDFDFEKLATIDFHRAYFESINFVLRTSKQHLFDSDYYYHEADTKKKEQLWREYIKKYSPFVVCSRRPAIGSVYLAENLERFKRQDFRLFGLPNSGLAFPRYYQRKAKESLISFKCLGKDSQFPSSESRLGSIVSLLHKLQDSRLSLENWREDAPYSWRVCYKKESGVSVRYIECDSFCPIRCKDLNFYDHKNKFMYQFDGYYYNVWAKVKKGVFCLLDKMDIIDVLHEIAPSWDRFHKQWITPFYNKRVLSEQDLDDYITHMYKPTKEKSSYDYFHDDILWRVRQEIDTHYKSKLLMSNSKQTF